MLIRVRSNVGVWRVDGLSEGTATVDHVVSKIHETRPHVVFQQDLSFDPAGKQLVLKDKRLIDQGLQHGSMVYALVDPETCIDVTVTSTSSDANNTENDNNEHKTSHDKSDTAATKNHNMRRVIDKDGRIKFVPSNEAAKNFEDKGFRKGLLPLRDMKMQWTLNDFIALDSQYEFKIQRQESAICQQVSLDVPSTNEFQAYLQKFQFQRKRFAFLYGYFLSDNKDTSDATASATTTTSDATTKEDANKPKPTKVRVEAIYEPPQQVDPDTAEGFVPLEDPKEAVVDEIASLLGMRKVGWIFGHEARDDKDLVMSNAEILMAAEFQLEAAGGVAETPFVTVKVCPKITDEGTTVVSVEAFQVSQQCMAMVAEQALQLDINPKVCKVNETFTAIQEGKPSPTVENSFFLCVVPIVQHTSTKLLCDFPRLNRDVDDRCPSHDELRKSLQKSGSSGWTFEERLADLNLLVYLSDFLDVQTDLVKICTALANQQPLDDGYKLILKSMAGMEGSY